MKIWHGFSEPPAPAVRSFIERSQPREASERNPKPQGKRELTPAQVAKR